MGRGTEALHFLNSDITIAESKSMYNHFSPRDADLKARREYKAEKPKPKEPEMEQAELNLF